MDNRIGKVAWGLTLIAVAVFIILGVTNVIETGDIFRTWWPMIIIIPAFFSFVAGGFGGGSLILLVIGVFILMNNLDVLGWALTRKLVIPVILLLLGLMIIIRSIRRGYNERRVDADLSNAPEIVAAFSSRNESFAGMPFMGARVDAIFGSVLLDLRGANITGDTVINADATFGSVVILSPGNVRFKVHSSGFFGGASKASGVDGSAGDAAFVPTIHINATSVFGGVKIR